MNKRAKIVGLLVLLAVPALLISAATRADDTDLVWTGDDDLIVVGDGHRVQFFDEEARGAYLGVTLGDVDDDTAKEAGVSKGKGALIRTVFDDSPADEAGIEAGDIVVEFDGSPVKGMDHLVKLVRAGEPGEEVDLEIRRDGKKKRLSATLSQRERSFSLRSERLRHPERWHAQSMPWFDRHDFGPRRARIGAEIRDLNEDLAKYFPGSEQGGALLLSVGDDSPAEKAGLKAGDVIVKLGTRDIADVDDLQHALGKLDDEEDVEVEYLREGKRRQCQVTPEQGGAFWTRALDKGEKHLIRIQEKLEGGDFEEKLEAMEKKLQELERKLEREQG